MKEISEQELGKLISDSFGRNDILKDINANVMRTLKAERRRAFLQQWLRIVAFCMCFSFAIVMPIAAIYYFWQATNSLLLCAPFNVGMLFLLVVLTVEFNRLMSDFSFRRL